MFCYPTAKPRTRLECFIILAARYPNAPITFTDLGRIKMELTACSLSRASVDATSLGISKSLCESSSRSSLTLCSKSTQLVSKLSIDWKIKTGASSFTLPCVRALGHSIYQGPRPEGLIWRGRNERLCEKFPLSHSASPMSYSIKSVLSIGSFNMDLHRRTKPNRVLERSCDPNRR